MKRQVVNFWRYLLPSVVLTANVLWALLFIASAYSDRISPEDFLIFSYLGLAFPFFLAGTLGFIVYWLFFGRKKFVLVSLLALLLCWNPLALYIPLHPKTDEVPKEHTLKVLSYNIMQFAYKAHTKDAPNPIIRYLAESGADIICLQEYMEFPQKNLLTRQKIYRELKAYPYRSIFKDGEKSGIAVFSKYPIKNSRLIPYKSKTNRSSVHTITVEGKEITLINNHLESFKLTSEDRSRYADFFKSMDVEHFNDLKGTIRQKLGAAFRARAPQAEKVAEEIRKAKTDYVIVCGDFNDTPISYTHHTVQGGLLDAFGESGCGLGVSYNENMFWFRIDNILCSPNIKPYNCTVEKIKYSDHYPIWSYLELR